MPKDPTQQGAFASTLKEKYEPYFNKLNETLPAVKPGGDYKEQVDFIIERNDVQYVAESAQKAVTQAVKSLDEGQMKRFYNFMVDEKRRQDFTPEKMKNPEKLWLFDKSMTGGRQSWLSAALYLDALMTPEQRENALKGIDNLYPPTDERCPKDRKVRRLQGEKIQELKSNLPDGPGKAEDLQLLDEVNEILSVPTEETSKFLQGRVKKAVKMEPGALPGMPPTTRNVCGLDELTAYAGYRSEEDYFSRPENAGKTKRMKEKSKSVYSKCYDESDISPYSKNKPTEEELRDYAEAKPEVSGKTLDAVQRIDEMFYELSPQIAPGMLDGELHKSPQCEGGRKDYGFIPLVSANYELENAVKEGDMDKIRESRQKYGALKTQIDRMLEVTKPQEGQMHMFGGNLASTRHISDGNRVPLEYQEKFIAHSRFNGLYLLHNASQASGIPIEDIVKEPGKACEKMREQHSEDFGLRWKGNIGARLWRALNPGQHVTFQIKWGAGFGGCVGRGMEAVAGMAYSAKERDDLTGVSRLASARAYHDINREGDAWGAMAKDGRKTLLQAAVLKSDDELDMLDFALKYKEGKRPSIDAMCEEKAKNGLDFNAIVDRIDEVDKSIGDIDEAQAREHKAQKMPYDPSISVFERKSAFRELGLKLMDMASERDKQTPGYQRMQQKTTALAMEIGGKETLDTLGKNLLALRTPKKGLFTSSKNSPEHQDMTRKQQDVLLKLSMMNGEKMNLPEEQRRRIESTPLSKLVRDAKNSTFEYMRLKSNNGEKVGFASDAGTARYDAAKSSLETLEALSDKLNLRSPAEKMIDDAKREMLDKPGSEKAMKRCAAKIVLGQSMMKDPGKFPPEKQAEALKGDKLDKNIENIVQNPNFQRFAQNAGNKLQEKILKEPGKLYNSYVGAVKAADRERANSEPQIQTATRHVEKARKPERKNSAPQIGGM